MFSQSFFFRLTVSIEASLSDNMRLIDVNGNPHPMTKFQVRMMIMIGWLAFLLAGLMNILFYKFHPSFVDFNPKRFKEKCFIYVLGRKIIFFRGGAKQENSQTGKIVKPESKVPKSRPKGLGLTLKSHGPPP